MEKRKDEKMKEHLSLFQSVSPKKQSGVRMRVRRDRLIPANWNMFLRHNEYKKSHRNGKIHKVKMGVTTVTGGIKTFF